MVSTRAMARRRKTTFRFLNLPGEMRMNIYKFAMPQHVRIKIVKKMLLSKDKDINGELMKDDDCLPYFIFTNRFISNEARPLFWQRVMLVAVARADGARASTFRENIRFSTSQLPFIENLEVSSYGFQQDLKFGAPLLKKLKHIDIRVDNRCWTWYVTPRGSKSTSFLESLTQANNLSNTPELMCRCLMAWLPLFDEFEDHVSQPQWQSQLTSVYLNHKVTVTIDTWNLHLYVRSPHNGPESQGWTCYKVRANAMVDLNEMSVDVGLSNPHCDGIVEHHVGNHQLPPGKWMRDLQLIDPKGHWDKFFQPCGASLLDVLLFKVLSERGSLKSSEEKSFTCDMGGNKGCDFCDQSETPGQ